MRVTTASTAAAKIAIELGRPVLWTVVAAILLAAAVMLSGCTQTRPRFILSGPRGAGRLVALLIRGFADASIFAQAVSIIAAATVGLALAQSSG